MRGLRTFFALAGLAVVAPAIAVGLIVAATPRHPASIGKGTAR